MANVMSIKHAFTGQELELIEAALEEYIFAHVMSQNQQKEIDRLLSAILLAHSFLKNGI